MQLSQALTEGTLATPLSTPPPQLSQALPEGTLSSPLPPDPADITDDQLRSVLRALWGHPDFRGRQLQVLRSVLKAEPLLAVLPTGAGKSMCYQLPAALLPGMCGLGW